MQVVYNFSQIANNLKKKTPYKFSTVSTRESKIIIRTIKEIICHTLIDIAFS